MKELKLGVVGSRDYHNYDLIKKVLDKFKSSVEILTIVSGGANGVDTLAKRYAEENNLRYVEFLAEWLIYGKGAGMIRNKKIVDFSDFIIAFQHNKSPGTQNTINLALANSKKIKVLEV